jgi:hypothetical protein
LRRPAESMKFTNSPSPCSIAVTKLRRRTASSRTVESPVASYSRRYDRGPSGVVETRDSSNPSRLGDPSADNRAPRRKGDDRTFRPRTTAFRPRC